MKDKVEPRTVQQLSPIELQAECYVRIMRIEQHKAELKELQEELSKRQPPTKAD